ncbi:hypothetical protein LAZ67_10000469 [Cordylochernes scorpioides]|uniref:Reverse transcriptase domain-containing protein n=1 Tax=Cordylochernes scorpioides TaxID=51811 RepID=A0ABY6KXW9_9ARAC|nr:hypothetical protein LAZ67_10000469 [Cordylochernes scorpioides]
MGKNFKSIDHVRCGPPPRFPRMCGTSLKTINNIIRKDLELDTRRKGKVHKLTPFHMKNRATNARKLYEEHLAGSRSEYTATLDEAWMYVTYCNGIRKICFMVVGVMTGRGVLPLIKVPSKVKVNSEFYIECVLKPVIEQLKDLYPGEMDKVFLHHDKASSHTSNKTQQFLQEMKDTLGLNNIRNSDIPVKSPDASPLDFYGFESSNSITIKGSSKNEIYFLREIERKSIKILHKYGTFAAPLTKNSLKETLKIKVEGATSAKVVRALLDTGSQRSYILSKTAQDLGLSPIGQESLKHVVFGGYTSESVHQEYRVNLGHASGNFKMVSKLLDQQKICGSLPRLSRGPWLKELKARRIWVPDIGKDDMEIEILLGCDVLGSIFMMKSCVLSNGLTASQTRFGWTLMGECQPGSDVSLAHHVTTMTISESSITNLWNLDVLGIMDTIEVKQRDQRDALARRHFLKTVQHSVSGRYVVSLPWTVEKAKIADNREVAMKRLEQTTKKLISLNLYEDYDDIFRGWLDDGIIEKVPAEQHDAEAFYLPHRPVVKLSSGTTPIRPVLDASSKVYRSPFLNDCLEKGPNLIEMIPNLMLRFRNGKFGVVADIKKAFLQIEVNERERDYLRFLWYSQNREKTEVFRHRRVVFGVNCSPFILGAVIEYHLSNVRPEHKPLAQRLQKSFYVDNLVTSVNSFEELQDIKLTATSIMDNARLELSRWEHSLDVASDTYPFERAEISKVLGICWDKREDCLSCEIPVAIPPKITKRSILSCLAQIYDPIGFLSPILIKPKILLQKAWTLKLAWDDELDRHYKDELSLWFDDLQLHKGMAIPRNFNPLMVPQKDWQIHTFVDASSEAYAAVVFLRTRVGDKVEVHMMAAKSRVAPLKRPTIPRRELLACVVGTRLNKMIFEALELKDIKNVFWSDATTALAWIKRDDQWGTFVGNRVKEICRLSDPGNWRYVPSECNPADLPSRGCSLSRLIQSRWYKDLNEEEIYAERKKIAVVTTVKSTDHWYMKYFSSFLKNVGRDGVNRLVKHVFLLNEKSKFYVKLKYRVFLSFFG